MTGGLECELKPGKFSSSPWKQKNRTLVCSYQPSLLAEPYDNIPAPLQYLGVCSAPAPPHPCPLLSPHPDVTQARKGTGQSHSERSHPLQHCWWMSCCSIPGWELSCAGAVHPHRTRCPRCPGQLSLHRPTLRICIFLSNALTLSARAELTSEQALA